MASEVNRRTFLSLSGSSLLSGKLHGGSISRGGSERGHTMPRDAAAGAGSRPNLILFMPDEMRADSLSCYGNPVTRTPNFDGLAKEGTRFENCHVQYPVCAASRCAMLTGWPTSVRGHRSLYYLLRPDEPNLFRYLRRAGYDVFWFGKNDALAAQCFTDSVTRWADIGSEALPRGASQTLTPGSLSMLYTAGGDRRDTNDYKLLEMAIEVLQRKESERPFCIFLPLTQPHPPYTAPRDFYEMYSPASLPGLTPAGLPRKPDFHQGIRRAYHLTNLRDETFRKIRAVYYGQVSYSDWLLGELLEAVEKNDRRKDTAVFVTSDHGDYAGDYGLVEKWPSGLEDCLTQVPLIARLPGATAGVRAEDMIEMYDIMQTFLDLAGASATHTHFSRSLLPQMHGGSGDSNRAAFAEGGYNLYEPQCFEPPGSGGGPYAGKIRLQNEEPQTVARSAMVRTRTHKLIVRPQGQCEMYDEHADPQETRNIFDDSSVSGIQQSLQTKLLHHYIQTTGIAPTDKDPRDTPPFYPTRSDLPTVAWQRSLLD